MSRLLLRFVDARQAIAAGYSEALTLSESSTDSGVVNAIEAPQETLVFAEHGHDALNTDSLQENLNLLEARFDLREFVPFHLTEVIPFTEFPFDADGIVLREALLEQIDTWRELAQESFASGQVPGDATEAVSERITIGEVSVESIGAFPETAVEDLALVETLYDLYGTHTFDEMTENVAVGETGPSVLAEPSFMTYTLLWTEGSADSYFHPQQNFTETHSEFVVLSEATFNDLLVATGVTLIEVRSDYMGLGEAGAETVTITEARNDSFQHLNYTEDSLTELLSTAWSEANTNTTGRSDPAAETITVSEARLSALAWTDIASETPTFGEARTDDYAHTGNAWTETATENITFGETRAALAALSEPTTESFTVTETRISPLGGVDVTTENLNLGSA